MRLANYLNQLLVDTQMSLLLKDRGRYWYLSPALKRVLEYLYNKRAHNYQGRPNYLGDSD